MSANIDDVARDVARALRDPNLTAHDSETLACLIVKTRYSYDECRAAVVEVRSRALCDLPLDVGFVLKVLHWRRPRPMVIEPPSSWSGPPTNVLHLYTRANGGTIGERRARTLGERELREEVRDCIKRALRRAVGYKPIANTNDPELTESPDWHTKVQSAWVRGAVGRGCGAQ